MKIPSPLGLGLGLALALSACGGADTPIPLPLDTTPPTVSITDDVDAPTATGEVTFELVFSEEIAPALTAAQVSVTGGTKGQLVTRDDTHATLVVTPALDTTGTMMVSVAAGAFTDLAGNANVAPATASQAFDTTTPPLQRPMSLPVTFDEAGVMYGLLGFAGAEDATIGADPADATNRAAKVLKSASAETYAGVTLTADGTTGFASAVPFDAANTRLTVRVYAPDAGVAVRLKLEDATDAAVSVETEATTTMADAWQTLTFEFARPANGTAPLDFAKTYDKATLFFGFGVDGATAGATTYYFDDVVFLGGTTGAGSGYETITFDDGAVPYALIGFGGADDSTVVTDPEGGANQVARVLKSSTAELWAGTTVATGANESIPRLPIDAANTRMTVRVRSPDAGIPVRLKIENANDPTVSVETEATTTVANAWEVLTFDFVDEAPGTAALNVASTYDKISIFFDFGTDGATAGEKVYHFDDIVFLGGTGGGGGGGGSFETVTFDDGAVTYTLTGFGGAEDATVVTDPAGGSNKVARVVKSSVAELWAGTTVSTGANESIGTLPIDAANTRMTVRVFAPDAGIPVRLKVENANDPGVSVETEALTTTAGGWETLTFDFASPAAGTAALNPGATYDKLSIFFDFGTTGAMAGEKVYHFDDIVFIGGTGGGGGGGTFDPITFDDGAVTYTLTGFGGAEDATLVTDPTDAANHVARVVKSGVAELWAGTTVSTGPNFSIPRVPFSAGHTRMTVRVYSPHAGIQVRLKVERSDDPTTTVETEATVTLVDAWQTLTFDFASEAPGTAALDLARTYDKASIFFNFGVEGAVAGERTYLFDDIAFAP